MLDRSKVLIISIVVLAALLAGAGITFRYFYGRRALEFWGAEHAARIRNASDVQVLRLTPHAEAGAETIINPQGAALFCEASKNIGEHPDLLHIRRVFVQDAYFEWDSTSHPERNWTYALRFRDGTGVSTLLLNDADGEVQLLENGQQATFNTPVMRSVVRFVKQNIPPAEGVK
ncbi:MAG TPA: hypothetical protein VL096_21360 [Pirellulaceae bacterium]|nr:hypothetical protein [Pirellulaceae bacterium]